MRFKLLYDKQMKERSFTLSKQKTFDPYAIWQDYYKNVETFWGQSMEEKMKTEEFSEWMGKILDANLLYREMADKSAKQYLNIMNLPSREDLANVSSLIINLDTKVDDLEEQLEESIENQLAPAVVKREMTILKKEVKEIGHKLDEVLSFLKEKKQEKETNEKK